MACIDETQEPSQAESFELSFPRRETWQNLHRNVATQIEEEAIGHDHQPLAISHDHKP
jgi:hypothetical protein